MDTTQRKQYSIGFKRLTSLLLFFLFLPLSMGVARENSVLVSQGDGVFQDMENNTMWQVEHSKKLKSSAEVKQYLKILNEGVYSDWRLPTKHELYELDSIFDLKRNGEVKIQIEGNYWLAGVKGEMSVGTWEIGDGCGPERAFFRGKKGYVRAVRP